MFKEFTHYTAWTDTMIDRHRFIGLIEYQPKRAGGETKVLWVITPDLLCEYQAEVAADKMLEQICEITLSGKVIYNDGIAL